MSWDALGAMGELLGAFAVAITLVYLSIQMKENNKNLKVQSLNDTFRERNEMTRELQDQSGLGGIFVKVLTDEELDGAESQEAGMFFLRVCLLNEKLLYLHSIGAADEFNFESFGRQLPSMFSNRFFDQWWATSKLQFSEGFQKHVDRIRDA